MRLPHALELFGLFGGGQVDGGMGGVSNSQFVVLPNTLHWSILIRADLLMPIVTPFLDAPKTQATRERRIAKIVEQVSGA